MQLDPESLSSTYFADNGSSEDAARRFRRKPVLIDMTLNEVSGRVEAHVETPVSDIPGPPDG